MNQLEQSIGILVIATLLAMNVASGGFAQSSTAFTYQGELEQNGSQANGSFDMEFSLYSAESDGFLFGSNSHDNVSVQEGRFSVQLDFGADAFNNQNRYLEISVEGFTLAPRNPVTRSPYSVQTRGIFVNDSGRVGIGTTTPNANARLTVNPDGALRAIHATSGTANSPTIYAANANTSGPVLWADAVQDVTLQGGGIIEIGQFNDFNLAIDRNEIMSRFNGETSTLHLNLEGGDVVTGGRLGVGTDPGFAQLQVFDTEPGVAFGLEVRTTQQDSFPSILAANDAGGPVFWAEGTSDVTPEGGGLIVAGSEASQNLAIDTNEIMARNNGDPSTLFLNAEGGDIKMGPQQAHPAFAYAKISGFPGIVTVVRSTPNVLGVTRLSDGRYSVEIDGGVDSNDIFIVSSNTPDIVGSAGIELLGGNISCLCCNFYEADSGDPRNCSFSLVIYRH